MIGINFLEAVERLSIEHNTSTHLHIRDSLFIPINQKCNWRENEELEEFKKADLMYGLYQWPYAVNLTTTTIKQFPNQCGSLLLSGLPTGNDFKVALEIAKLLNYTTLYTTQIGIYVERYKELGFESIDSFKNRRTYSEVELLKYKIDYE